MAKNTGYGTLKKPMTAKELVNIIADEMKEKGTLPKELDYVSGSSDCLITYYEFEFECVTKWGGSEGIYTDFYLNGNFTGESGAVKRLYIGCAKTLSEGTKAMYMMNKFAADFYMTATDYINHHIDDFTWEGYNLRFEGENGSLEISSLERVRERIKRFMEEGRDLSKLVITDLETRCVLSVEEIM